MNAPPTVTTIAVSGIENSSVTLNGNIDRLGTNNDGSQQISEYGFIYSINASRADSLQLGETGVKKIAGDSIANTGQYSHVIANLPPGTIHYFRAFAINDGGTSYGGVSNFSTTYHQIFALSGVTNGVQSNNIYPQSTHTYSIPLSHLLCYSLTIESTSNISRSVTVYEGLSSDPLYTKAGPFTSAPSGTGSATNVTGGSTNVLPFPAPTFSGITNGKRYMVLPLASNSHRIVVSNNGEQNENYSLNLEEYLGTNPDTRRLLIYPKRMGYYDSANDPRFFWVHVPPNKNLEVRLDAFRSSSGFVGITYPGRATITISSTLSSTKTFTINSNESQYVALSMRNTLDASPFVAFQSTNFRLVFGFVDP